MEILSGQHAQFFEHDIARGSAPSIHYLICLDQEAKEKKAITKGQESSTWFVN